MSSNLNKKASVKEIFGKMDYDNNSKENYDLALAWCNKYGNNFKTSSITSEKFEIFGSDSKKFMIEVNKISPENVTNILKECQASFEEWTKITDLKKSQILNKFSDEIEKHSTLLCQLEMIFRDIFIRDTKKFTVPLFKEYLQYYSGWTSIKTKKFPNLSPYGISLFSLDLNTPLALLGMVMSACLATGNTLVINADKNLVPICFLLRELAILSGVPKNVIQIINGDMQILLKEEVIKKFVYIGDLFELNSKCLEMRDDVDLSCLHLGKSSMLVFDSSDLDSVADAVLEATTTYKGHFPWSLDKVYVQETVYESLKNKLLKKFEKLRVVENSLMKVGDVTKNSQIDLKFGHREAGNCIIGSDKTSGNVLNVLPFRTSNEGVALVNNSRIGLSVSVWTENISLANEINPKLKNTLIWYNSWGTLDPSCSFSPYKKSGKGFFGGKEGFLEFLKHNTKVDFSSKNLYKKTSITSELPGDQKSDAFICFGGHKKCNDNEIVKLVDITLKSQENWKKLSIIKRGQIFRKFADNSENLETEIPTWTEMLYNWSLYEIPLKNEPLGTIVIEFTSSKLLNLIFGAIYSGNSVIILNRCEISQKLFKEICAKCNNLPAGVLNVINFYNEEVAMSLKNHQEIKGYFMASENKNIKLIGMDFIKIYDLKKVELDSFEGVLRFVTRNKNVYFSTGQSFI